MGSVYWVCSSIAQNPVWNYFTPGPDERSTSEVVVTWLLSGFKEEDEICTLEKIEPAKPCIVQKPFGLLALWRRMRIGPRRLYLERDRPIGASELSHNREVDPFS